MNGTHNVKTTQNHVPGIREGCLGRNEKLFSDIAAFNVGVGSTKMTKRRDS